MTNIYIYINVPPGHSPGRTIEEAANSKTSRRTNNPIEAGLDTLVIGVEKFVGFALPKLGNLTKKTVAAGCKYAWRRLKKQ